MLLKTSSETSLSIDRTLRDMETYSVKASFALAIIVTSPTNNPIIRMLNVIESIRHLVLF